MKFSFLHAADLHLGSPLLGLSLKDEAIARRFAGASRQAFTNLVAYAIEAQVAFVIIAGDVYDGDWKDSSIGLFFAREVARLHRAGIPVYLLKGNHDAESVITKTITLPANVHEFSTKRAQTFELSDLRVALHGRSFAQRAESENYAQAYPEPRPGWFNIGVLHTSCDGRPGHAAYAPCTVEDMARRSYHYWALGHVHAFETLSADPLIVYPGNLQGRSVRECGPRGAVLVEVDDDRVAHRHIAFDTARWAVETVDLTDIETESAAFGRIEDTIRPVVEAAEGRLIALRVRLRGRSSLYRRFKADTARLLDEVQAAAHRCHEDVWIEKLGIDLQAPSEIVSTDHGGSALDLAAMLAGCDEDPEVLQSVDEIIGLIKGKLPGGMIDEDIGFTETLQALIEDARALTLGRAQGVKAG